MDQLPVQTHLVIIGAGGHAKVVLSTALDSDENVFGFVDDHPALIGKILNGYPVHGNLSLLYENKFNAAVCALGNNGVRKNCCNRYTHHIAQWKKLIHPTAYVHPSAQIGDGTVIFAGAVIQPDVRVGKHCIINTGATVDHDCIIEDYVHLAPGVHLAGGVRVGEGAFLGIGSVVIPGVQIGNWVTVAAGGVVVGTIPAKKTVMGVPAKERMSSC